MKPVFPTDTAGRIRWRQFLRTTREGETFEIKESQRLNIWCAAHRGGIRIKTKRSGPARIKVTVLESSQSQRMAAMEFFQSLPTRTLMKVYQSCIQAGIKS